MNTLLTVSKIGFFTSGAFAFGMTGYTLLPKSKYMQMKQLEHKNNVSSSNAIVDGMSATNKLFGFALTEPQAQKKDQEQR